MQNRRAFLSRSIAVALAGMALPAAALPENQEWQCSAGTGGGWDCKTVSVPQGVYTRAGRLAPLRAPAPAVPAPDSAYQLAQTMDWSPKEQLGPEQRAALPAHCEGTYVEPPLEPLPAASAVFGTVQASADESELQREPDIARFTGNVMVRQDERRLRADKATFYRDEDRIQIEGDVQYREPGLLVRGESAELRTAENAGELQKTRFVMHREHSRGEAAVVRRNADRSIDMEDASYTQCEPGSDDWAIGARTIHLDRDKGQGIARNATLRVKDVPVLYTPYHR